MMKKNTRAITWKNKLILGALQSEDEKHQELYIVQVWSRDTEKKIVQLADSLESELTEWYNSCAGTTPGSMYNQIVVGPV